MTGHPGRTRRRLGTAVSAGRGSLAPAAAAGRARRALALLDSPGDAVLAARMLGWAVVLPALKVALPLKSLVAFMAPRAGAGSRAGVAPRADAAERKIARLAHLAHRAVNLGLRDNCLERSLIAYRYLAAAGAAPVLVVGARAGEQALEGHVWVLVDGLPVHDSAAAAAEYVTVTTFGADGVRADAPSGSTT